MKPMVLMAEGDAELCDLYKKYIAARGYEVETASNGLDCLKKLRCLMPAVVVLDMDLRWGGGNGVLAWLREERATSEVAVILTAPAGYPLDAAEVMEPPVVRFLCKPFGLTGLLESIGSAVAQGQAAARNVEHALAGSELFIG
jgi:two-component system KDP operon response regulator KdpE